MRGLSAPGGGAERGTFVRVFVLCFRLSLRAAPAQSPCLSTHSGRRRRRTPRCSGSRPSWKEEGRKGEGKRSLEGETKSGVSGVRRERKWFSTLCFFWGARRRAHAPHTMSFFSRVMNHLLNEVLVNGLANRYNERRASAGRRRDGSWERGGTGRRMRGVALGRGHAPLRAPPGGPPSTGGPACGISASVAAPNAPPERGKEEGHPCQRPRPRSRSLSRSLSLSTPPAAPSSASPSSPTP
jgi:hypothetical protein